MQKIKFIGAGFCSEIGTGWVAFQFMPQKLWLQCY